MRVSATAHKPCRVRELHGVRMCQWLGTEVESGWIGRRLMGVCVVSMQGAGVSGGVVRATERLQVHEASTCLTRHTHVSAAQ